MLTLESPNPHHRAAFIAAAHSYAASGDATLIQRYRQAIHDFDGFLGTLSDMASGIGLAASWVPMRSYFLLKEQATIVGVARLRTRLTSALELDGGHIGYDIVPGYRRLGYGTELLRLSLGQARAAGLTRVIVITEPANLGSINIIERNGGRFLDEQVVNSQGKRMRRYLIELG
jgi:predicted acetyltransferase